MTTTDNTVRNGVDIPTLFATLDAVKGNPEIAKFQFRATNRWVSGTHNRSTIHGFYGAMQEMTPPAAAVRRRPPRGARRRRQRPDAGRVPPARARRLPHRGHRQHRRRPRREPQRVRSTVEGDIDLIGILGLDQVRNGFQQIKVSFSSRATTPRSSAGSSSSPAPDRPSSTSSPTACRSPSRSTPADRRSPARHRRPPAPAAGRRAARPPVHGTPARQRTHTLVIGAGQAGLATSRLLTDAGRRPRGRRPGPVGRAVAKRAMALPAPPHPNWMSRPPVWSYNLPTPTASRPPPSERSVPCVGSRSPLPSWQSVRVTDRMPTSRQAFRGSHEFIEHFNEREQIGALMFPGRGG